MQPAAHSTKVLKDLCDRALAQAATLAELFTQLESYCQQPEFTRRPQQLLEVSCAIDKLEAKHVPVPQDLRRLKTELLAQADNDELVEQTFAAISELLARTAATHEVLRRANTTDGSLTSKPASTTPFRVLRSHLIKSLEEMGGSGPATEILDSIESKLRAVLRPGDLQKDTQGNTTWRSNARMVRHHLVKQGVLRSGSPRGIWQLIAKPS